MNRAYGIEKTLVTFALILMIAIIVGCWYLTSNVPLTVIVGLAIGSFFNIFDNYIILVISENREKDRINKENKDNYKKYKKRYPESIKDLQKQIKKIKKTKWISDKRNERNNHNFVILTDYKFIYMYPNNAKNDVYTVKDMFIELLEEDVRELEEDLGGVDRY